MRAFQPREVRLAADGAWTVQTVVCSCGVWSLLDTLGALMDRRRWLRKAIACLSVVITSCGDAHPAPNRTPITPPGPQVVSLAIKDFTYTPSTIRANPIVDEITLEIRNHGSRTHNFTIEPLAISEDLEPGHLLVQSIVFPHSGTYRFYCKYHWRQGMAGILVAGSSDTPVP